MLSVRRDVYAYKSAYIFIYDADVSGVSDSGGYAETERRRGGHGKALEDSHQSITGLLSAAPPTSCRAGF